MTAVPGGPSLWKIVLADTKIRCGVEKELHSALQVFAADRYGNRARADTEEDSTVEPILAVTGATLNASGPKSGQIRQLSLRPKSRRLSGTEHYLVPVYQIGEKARVDGTACQCEVAVSDADGRFQSCRDNFDLVAGKPSRIILDSNIIDDAVKEDEHVENTRYAAHVPARYKLEDLQARVVDTGGNVVEGVDVPLTLAVTEESDVTMSRSKGKARIRGGVAKFPSATLSAGRSATSYTLQVDGPGLFSAQLVCQVVLSNAVTNMEHELSIETAVCGKPLDVRLKLHLTTEDGTSFVPNAESFDCMIKRKTENQARPSQQHKTAIPVMLPFDGGAAVKDGQWILDEVDGDARSFVPEQTGTYLITCTYNESRVSAQTDKKLKPLKLDVHVRAAPAVRLVCSIKVGSRVNANNGQAPIGRKLLKYKIKCEDTYGNSAAFPEDCSVRAMLTGAAGTDQTKWPALQDAQDSGVHKGCVVMLATNTDTTNYQRVGLASFDLYLQEGVGDQEGLYELKFDLVSHVSDSEQVAVDVEPLTTQVNFTPDGIRSKEIEDKQAQLDDLTAERNRLTENFDRADAAFRDLKTDMKDKVKQLKALLTTLTAAGIEWAQEDLDACNKTPEQEGVAAKVKHVLSSAICQHIATNAEKHSRLLDQEKPRPAKVQQRKGMDAIRTLGKLIVELGFVDDEDLAHTLSWAAGTSLMECVVAPDSTRQKQLYSVHRCTTLSEDQMEAFRDRRGERTMEDKARAILPLELPLSHIKGNWPADRSEPVRPYSLLLVMARSLTVQTLWLFLCT